MRIEIDTKRKYIGVDQCSDLSELGKILTAIAPYTKGYFLHTANPAITRQYELEDDFFGVTNNTMDVSDEEIEDS